MLYVRADAEKFTVPFDLWISNGVISRMAFDVVALVEANPHLAEDEEDELPEDVTRLAIALDLSEFRGGVEEPSDAVDVDLFEIVGRLMGGAFTELEGELGGM